MYFLIYQIPKGANTTSTNELFLYDCFCSMLHTFDDRHRSTDCITEIIPTSAEVKAYV